jgi:hypothetical protein
MQDLPLSESMRQERRAGKLWSTLASGPADTAFQAMARFAAEPSAAVKMARLRMKPAESTESMGESDLTDRRGIELLESLGTMEARSFLVELSRGEPTARRTREAKRALERLEYLSTSGSVKK